MYGAGILDHMDKYDCTGFGGVPVHFIRLVGALDQAKKPPRWRFLMNSGDHLPVSIIQEIRNSLPEVQIFCVYGLTEVAGRLCILPPKIIDRKMGSVGLPLNGMQVTIRDEKGELVSPFEEGEVFAEGSCLMSGYLNNTAVNLKVMKTYGFATGDYGYLDDDGYLFLRGRKDDIFKVGGEKVSVKMIEEHIYGFEGIEDFIVIPFLDKHMGMVPCLYYVPDMVSEFSRKKLLRKLRKELPPTHIPAIIKQVSQIPRTSSGKAVRKSVNI
jgi:acyl-CoA synthetase (AMP-forming)/AMP-acid ligase II